MSELHVGRLAPTLMRSDIVVKKMSRHFITCIPTALFSFFLLLGCQTKQKQYWLEGETIMEKDGTRTVNYIDPADSSHRLAIHWYNETDTFEVMEYRHRHTDGVYKQFKPGNEILIITYLRNDSVIGRLNRYAKGRLEVSENYEKGHKAGSQYKYYKNGKINEYHCYDDVQEFFFRDYNPEGLRTKEDYGKYLGGAFLEDDRDNSNREFVTFWVATPPDDSLVFVYANYKKGDKWSGPIDTLPIYRSRVKIWVDRNNKEPRVMLWGVRGFNRISGKEVFESAMLDYQNFH